MPAPAAPAPSTAPPTVSALVLQAGRLEIAAMRQLAARADLVDALGQLIRRLQRERGASGIFLASGGTRFADEHRQLAEDSRQAQARLRAVFGQQLGAEAGASAQSLSLMAWALLGLDAMEGLRQQIEHRAMEAGALVAAFSHLIAGLVELVFHVADAAAVPSVSRLLVALLHLVQAQEEAGQERALGALLFACGTVGEAHQQRVLHLIEAQERNLAVFAEFADPALAARWSAEQLLPGVARLERLRRTLGAARPGAALDSELSAGWFDCCTERMDGMWRLQVELVQRLREDCAQRIAEAERELLDSQGLLRRLRASPPPRAQVVDRFFDGALAPEMPKADGSIAETASLHALVQAQAARLAAMEAELATARGALHERKLVDRAKALLMRRLELSEEAAFRLLQKTSMDQNRRLAEVAEATLGLADAALAQLAAPAPRPPR